MADLVGQIQRDIEKRLQELRPLIEEKEQLEAVLAALTNGSSTAAPAAPRARAATTRSAARAPYAAGKGRRAPRGANREAILSVVGDRPGATAAEISDVTKISRAVTYNTLAKLIEQGKLEKTELPGGQTGYKAVAP